MSDGEDLLYRPVLRGVLPAAALDDPAVDLGQIVALNEAIDVENENQARARRWLERSK